MKPFVAFLSLVIVGMVIFAAFNPSYQIISIALALSCIVSFILICIVASLES